MNLVHDVWKEVMAVLSKELNPVAINTWFSEIEPINLEDCRLVLYIEKETKKNIIEDRFTGHIKKALSDLFSTDFDVMFLSGDEEYAPEKEEDEKDNSLPEMAGYTFDRFIVGPSNTFAHAAAIAVSENPGGTTYNPLFIYGNSGLGKTHLLRAIGQAIHERSPEKKIAFIKGDDFTTQVVSAIREGTAEAFRNKYRQVDLFLVDDIQFIAGKQQTQNEFFNTFNSIYEAGHQIVITSDRPPIDMKLLDDRLRTRFEGGLMADIQPPDLETRMAIIRNKAAQLGLILSDESVVYIAEHITANVRQLEGVIKRLTAYREILNDVINLDAVKRAITDLTIKGDYIPKPEKIIRQTALYFNLKEEDLRGQNRSKTTARARQISMYLIRTLTTTSLADIGKEYESRNHATVLSSIRKIEELLNSDPKMLETIRDITSNINSQ